MSQEEQSLHAGAPSPQRVSDARQRPRGTADAHDPGRYMEAVYPLNRGLPHLVDFPEALD